MALCLVPDCAAHPGLTLFLDFQSHPPDRVLAALENEVARLLDVSPGAVLWKPLTDNDGTGTLGRLVVIHFEGRCEAVGDADDPGPNRKWVLGKTLISSGSVLPLVRIECDSVRAFLGRHPLGLEERSYARALGQVIAHELYHVLLATEHHSSSGVSKAAHSPSELGRISNHFEPLVRALMKQAVLAQGRVSARAMAVPEERRSTEALN